jgi:hypothetical protein
MFSMRLTLWYEESYDEDADNKNKQQQQQGFPVTL